MNGKSLQKKKKQHTHTYTQKTKPLLSSPSYTRCRSCVRQRESSIRAGAGKILGLKGWV